MCTCGCDPVAAVGQPCCGCGCCSGKDDQAQRVCARSWDKVLCGADFNQVLRAHRRLAAAMRSMGLRVRGLAAVMLRPEKVVVERLRAVFTCGGWRYSLTFSHYV
jgi:hypothetical protein